MPDPVIPIAQVKALLQELRNKARQVANDAFKLEQNAEALRNKEIGFRQAGDDVEDMIRAAEKV